MGKASKFTEEQKFAIALDLIAGKLSHAEVCRKCDTSTTYAYKLKDRAVEMQSEGEVSVRRIARVLDEPTSTVGRWTRRQETDEAVHRPRACSVSGNPDIRKAVRGLCDKPRNRACGHRRIWALLRREKGIFVNRKTVLRIMREEGRTRPKIRHKPKRPRRMPKVCATGPNQAWQIDMTSFHLSDLTPLFLVMVIDCFTREIVGWTLDRRCRASEWTSALRLALEKRGLTSKEMCGRLTLRSDNGSQPCSKAFVEYLGRTGVQGEHTGYNAPDDKDHISYYTSFVGFDTNGGSGWRSESFRP